MSSFEWNKIIGAVLVALLAIKTFDIVGNSLVHPDKLEQNVYVVAGVEAATPTDAGAAAPKELEKVGPLLASANADAGKKDVAKCMTCHNFDKGGPNKVGPNLWGIVGNHHAHAEGFAYSSAMKAKQGEQWDYEALNAFISSPRTYVPGTKMTFAGIPKASDRANIIAYLRTLSDNPTPLP
ncbi:MAG TPA: cytochrome c family protein [Alphaproteobacteria bacterium]|jgi:cytochrome c